MYSDQFTVAVHGRQTRWRLKMYPNGRKNVDQGYVTLFLKDSGRLVIACLNTCDIMTMNASEINQLI